MDGGETIDRHPREHAGPGSPPGWYADPTRESSLRRWDGAHWTDDVEPVADTGAESPSGVWGHSAVRLSWMWVAALGVPGVVTWSWMALYERDYHQMGDTLFAWMPLGVLELGVIALGVNLFAALVATIFRGSAAVMRIVITLFSGGLAVVDCIPLGFMGVTPGIYGNGEGFSGRSGAVMLVCLAVSLIPLVMMWLSARPSYGAGHRWWESAPVRVIPPVILMAVVGRTMAYWLTYAADW